MTYLRSLTVLLGFLLIPFIVISFIAVPMMTTPEDQLIDKLYFNYDEMPKDQDAFHIQTGANEYIKTSHIHRDQGGFFTWSHDIHTEKYTRGYIKEWKCPYCHKFWPIGTPCQNAACPSKYKS